MCRFRKKAIPILILGLLFLFSCWSFISYGNGDGMLFAHMAAADKPLRLHILANSDSPADQQLKLELRDQVIAYLQPRLAEADSKEEAMASLEQLQPELTDFCNDYLADHADYRAEIRLERTDFPSIDYDGLVFAAGEYDALRILLGKGGGHNWWCVLYPCLCFADLAAEKNDSAADEALILQGNGIRLAWRLAELFR